MLASSQMPFLPVKRAHVEKLIAEDVVWLKANARREAVVSP
jgi:hypothetical protein